MFSRGNAARRDLRRDRIFRAVLVDGPGLGHHLRRVAGEATERGVGEGVDVVVDLERYAELVEVLR